MRRITRPRAPDVGAGFRGVALALTLLVTVPAVASADTGFATWYGPGFQGNVMANGQTYNMYDPTTTACNILPFGTWVQVTNPANGRSVVVQVRDRGGFHYALDLSYAAFKLIANPAVMGISIRYQVVDGPSGVAVPRPATQSVSGGTSRPTSYSVQSGDTLSSIAGRFGVDQASLAAWNGITDADLVSVGQSLHLAAPPTPSPITGRSYLVQAGDTLIGIATRFGVSPDQLGSANGIADSALIQAGQSLTIPSGHRSGATRTYVVKAGDTISGIAQSLGVGQDSILAANQISNSNSISEGLTLSIPGA